MEHRVLKNTVSYMIIASIAFFMLRGIFAPGFMSGYDNSIHYYESYFLTQKLIPVKHWISGWSMQGLAGFPMLLHHPQTGFLLVAALNKIASLPLIVSYKIAVLFSYFFLGFGFYKISSSRFGAIPALIATACLMLQKDIYNDMILTGVWNNYLTLGIFLLFFHMLDKNIYSLTLRKAAFLGLLLGAIVPSHLFTAIFAFLVVLIYSFPYLTEELIRRKSFLKPLALYLLIPLLACLASVYYWYAFVAAGKYLTKVEPKSLVTGVTWGIKSFFGPLENSGKGVLSSAALNIPVFVRIVFSFLGAYFFLMKKDDPGIKFFLRSVAVFILISFILFCDILPNLFGWWQNVPLLGNIWTNRFVIYIQLGLYLFAAYGLSRILRFKAGNIAAAAAVILITVSAFFHYEFFAKDASATLEASPHMADVYKVWNWIDGNVLPGRERVVYQDTIGNIDDPILARSDVFALSGVFTKAGQIGVFLNATNFPREKAMDNKAGKIFGRPLEAAEASYVGEMMDRFNAGHIVSVEPRLADKLTGSDLFIKEQEFGLLRIFRLKSFDPSWIKFDKKADFTVSRFEDEDIKCSIESKSFDNLAVIKVAFHPFWKARLDNLPVNISQGDYGMMKVDLPDGGTHQLELVYKDNHLLLLMLSLAGVAAGAVLITYRK